MHDQRMGKPTTKPSFDIEDIVHRYASDRPLYESYSSKLQSLLTSLLESKDFKYQVVEARAKDVSSFRDKITRPGKSYSDPLSELPDLCGARIIVYYSDDVAKVAKLIDDEFNVVEQEMSHQPDAFDADRFGYLSVHYVIKLRNNRSSLGEWKFAENFRAEIQIRTVIQHAWSAVSHALQYKQETAIPSNLRRRLFRIAGLFELADEEFVGIRDAKEILAHTIAAAISAGDEDIPVNLASIRELTKNLNITSFMVSQAASAGFVVTEIDPEDVVYPEIYDISTKLGMKNISDISDLIREDNSKLFREIIQRFKGNWVVSPDYLIFFVLLKAISDSYTVEDLEQFDWGEERANIILSAAKSSR